MAQTITKPKLEKSQICEVCDKKCIGQTKCSFLVRFKEHQAQAKFDKPEKHGVT